MEKSSRKHSERHHRSRHLDTGGEDDRHHRSREDDGDHQRRRSSRELSYVDGETSYQREGSRDRAYEREDSAERKQSSKRKERGEESEDRYDGGEKRARVSDNNKEKRRLEDKVEAGKEANGGEKEERKEKRERRFEDKVNKEDMDDDEQGRLGLWDEKSVQKEPRIEPVDVSSFGLAANGSVSLANGASSEPLNRASRTLPETSLVPSHPPPTKVSSIYTTNENKGVNVNRSHAVPGKSSTDGRASDTGKSGGLSVDALAKAKLALQKQKQLSEKLKKITLLNKGAGTSGDGSPLLGSKEGLKTSSSSSAGILPIAAPTVAASVTAASVTPSATTLPAVAAAFVRPPAPPTGMPNIAGMTAQKYEAVKRAQELAAKMGFRQDPEFAPLINMFPGQIQPEVTIQPKPAKAPVLRLDALGREIDEHGNVVNMPKLNNLSTLKVNINKQKKDAFQILKPELEVDPEKNPHFDATMGIDKNKLLRPKRMTFQFVEEGKWSKEAEIIKLKSQFGEAQAKELKVKQAQLAKARAELDINPNLIEVSERVITKEKPKEQIPEIEWWDVPLMQNGTYGNIDDVLGGYIPEDRLKMEKITIYVQHPRPIEPPAEPASPPPQPLKLTAKERKKLHTQRRLAREKDRQEMIRQGLVEPPKPKVKMSNLMKVLGLEATQDPTKLEMEIRSAAAEREQAHVDRNNARKLTPAEHRQKKERKLFDEPGGLETIVSVYRINNLSHPQTRFKVDVNAQENRLTGCAVISAGVNVVVVEGGSKSIKRYGKLMLRRINWAAAVEDDEDDAEKPANKCVLVWQGSVAKASFHRFHVHECRTEAAARKIFSDAGVGHFWDLAVNFVDDHM